MTCYSIEYSNDGLHYACGIADASIQVFDAVTRKEEITLGGFNNKKVAGHQNKIFALKYHRENSKILISGGWDQVLIYWDLTTGTPIKKVTGPQLYGEGLDINCFDEILTASWRKDDPLEVWEYETGNRRMSIEASFKEKDNLRGSTQLYCCKFSKDYGRLIYAGGSQVNCVKIFDCFGTSVASIGEYSHAVLALDSSNDFSKGEQKLAVGGGDGKIRLYKIKYGPNFK
jgi:COMPASS component SWD3